MFEGGYTLGVECQSRNHVITYGTPVEGCQQLWDFLSGLPNRGKLPGHPG